MEDRLEEASRALHESKLRHEAELARLRETGRERHEREVSSIKAELEDERRSFKSRLDATIERSVTAKEGEIRKACEKERDEQIKLVLEKLDKEQETELQRKLDEMKRNHQQELMEAEQGIQELNSELNTKNECIRFLEKQVSQGKQDLAHREGELKTLYEGKHEVAARKVQSAELQLQQMQAEIEACNEEVKYTCCIQIVLVL